MWKFKALGMRALLFGAAQTMVPPLHASSKSVDNLLAIVNGNNAFAFDLFRKLAPEKENLFFSPISLSSALAMTYAGARGRTQKEMETVLHFSLGQAGTHGGYSRLRSALDTLARKNEIKLSIANSLWCQESFPFLQAFLDIGKNGTGPNRTWPTSVKKRTRSGNA